MFYKLVAILKRNPNINPLYVEDIAHNIRIGCYGIGIVLLIAVPLIVLKAILGL